MTLSEGHFHKANGTLSAEAAISTRANLYITEGAAAPGAQDLAMEAAGIPEVSGASWLEQTPLGQAEWIKYVAVFLNRNLRPARSSA
jgi:iron complex transport system substrate-binding protein